MITNDRQYRITKAQVAKFEEAINSFDEFALLEKGIDPVIVQAQRRSLQAQLDELRHDVTSYERLKSGQISRFFTTNVTEIGQRLIDARITQGLTQKQLANRLGLKEQQIQRYEQERYQSANLRRISEIAEALELDLHAFFETRASDSLAKIAPNLRSLDFDRRRLPVSEMKKRGWLRRIQLPRETADYSDDVLAAVYISQVMTSTGLRSFLKQKVRAKGVFDEYALIAWKARILHKAREAFRKTQVPKVTDNFAWVSELREMTNRNSGPIDVIEYLKTKGVLVVIEKHLTHTHLDGAAMLAESGRPVIGLTIRYDRLDNFWFVLLHELAHVVLHRNQGLEEGFFDDEEARATDILEQEADDFAQNALIPAEVWRSSFVRFSTSEDEVINFARKHHVHPSVVAGRIRRERNDYTLFKRLKAQGRLVEMFKKARLLE